MASALELCNVCNQQQPIEMICQRCFEKVIFSCTPRECWGLSFQSKKFYCDPCVLFYIRKNSQQFPDTEEDVGYVKVGTFSAETTPIKSETPAADEVEYMEIVEEPPSIEPIRIPPNLPRRQLFPETSTSDDATRLTSETQASGSSSRLGWRKDFFKFKVPPLSPTRGNKEDFSKGKATVVPKLPVLSPGRGNKEDLSKSKATVLSKVPFLSPRRGNKEDLFRSKATELPKVPSSSPLAFGIEDNSMASEDQEIAAMGEKLFQKLVEESKKQVTEFPEPNPTPKLKEICKVVKSSLGLYKKFKESPSKN